MAAYPKHHDLLVHENEPLNAEPSLSLLRERFITPVERFFVRSHGPTPTVDPTRYRLTVGGRVRQPLRLSLGQLRAEFPPQRVTATLQCAGNRRRELIEVQPIPGETPWEEGAIGTGVWGGVALRDVLQAAEVEVGPLHVAFQGLDSVTRRGEEVGFGGSVPLEKALGPEVLLAYELNGAPLPPEHGFPLRVVAPGYIGARNVKWLAAITVQDEPSDNYFQARAYKLFPSHVRAESVDWARGLMLGELSVTSVICCPLDGARVAPGLVRVAGYAFAGGGRTVERVDLSTDGGETWRQAALCEQGAPWAWCFWEVEVSLEPGAHTLIVRAWDSATNTQPERVEGLWNFKGYMNNAWHRVRVVCGGEGVQGCEGGTAISLP